jgi:hypothetical protein
MMTSVTFTDVHHVARAIAGQTMLDGMAAICRATVAQCIGFPGVAQHRKAPMTTYSVPDNATDPPGDTAETLVEFPLE